MWNFCEASLHPLLVGSLLYYTNKDVFLMPPVKMRYVTAVLTMRQVCFPSWTLSWVTALSNMCRAQLRDLDKSSTAGVIDCEQGQGWMIGMWHWLWFMTPVCSLHLNNLEKNWDCQVKATSAERTVSKVKNAGGVVVQRCAGEGLSLSVCVGSWDRRGRRVQRAPLPGRFLRWLEKGRNQVRLFLRP